LRAKLQEVLVVLDQELRGVKAVIDESLAEGLEYTRDRQSAVSVRLQPVIKAHEVFACPKDRSLLQGARSRTAFVSIPLRQNGERNGGIESKLSKHAAFHAG
jgi:hypothetical protein